LSHEPKNYDLPHHLAKIIASAEFAQAAKDLGKTPDAFSSDVEAELKKLVNKHRADELASFESDAAKLALSAAKAKSAA